MRGTCRWSTLVATTFTVALILAGCSEGSDDSPSAEPKIESESTDAQDTVASDDDQPADSQPDPSEVDPTEGLTCADLAPATGSAALAWNIAYEGGEKVNGRAVPPYPWPKNLDDLVGLGMAQPNDFFTIAGDGETPPTWTPLPGECSGVTMPTPTGL